MKQHIEPEEAELAVAVKRVLLELKIGGPSSSDFPKVTDVRELVRPEAFTPGTLSFLQGGNVKFFGTSGDRVAPADLPVIDAVGGKNGTCRFIGFADGHVERSSPGKRLRYVLEPDGNFVRLWEAT